MINRVLGSLFTIYALKRRRRIKKSYSRPLQLQEKNLKKILNDAEDTAFGREFGFKSIRTIADYQKNLPLFRYEMMKPWIDGCLDGRPDHLWPGRIEYFALSSGTTSGTSKYIPVSREAIMVNRRAGLDCIFFYLANTKDAGLFDGKFLLLGGSTALTTLKGGQKAGDMSGILSRVIPFYTFGVYEPRRELASIPDWEEKIKRVVESIKDKDMRVIAGVPSWLFILFEDILKAKGKDAICEVWPNISLLIYGGLDFSPYEKMMASMIGKDIYYMETYFSSEAFIGIQDTPCPPSRGISHKGLLLMLDYGTFYEFIKCDDIEERSARCYTVADIETDVNYAIVVTNNSGLYRYIIGDTVKFISKDPLRIKVTGRIENFLSALGEHVIAEEVDYAITQASNLTGALVANYTVAPHFPEGKARRPSHEWLIEFSKPPDDYDKFTKILDESLCLKNDDYRAHRKRDFGMSGPHIYELKEGTFYRWHKKMHQLGGQHKTPHLKNDRSMAEELIELNKTMMYNNEET